MIRPPPTKYCNSSHYRGRFKKVNLAGAWRRLLAVALFTVLPSLAQAEPEHITLQLKWAHQFQFAGYYAAIEQGYYRDAGLDVRLREAVPDTNPIHAVIEGEADYGVGTSDLLLDRAEGAPVVVLGVIFQHSAYALLVRADASIRSMKELRGKRIMLDSNGTDIVAMLQREGLPPGSYQHIEHNFKLDDWIKGKVDAVDVYMTDQPFNLSQQGIAYRIFKPINSGVDFYGDNLFTTEQEIRNHPQRVQAFLDASLKGWDYAMHHSDEIISLILKKYSSRHSRKQLRFEANAMQPLLEYETVPTGYMFASRWRDIVRTYQQLGTLPVDFKLQGFLYKPTTHFFTKLWSWRWQILVALLIVILLLAAIFVAFLRKLVNQRTEELQQSRQQAEQANAAKSHFLAAASHDMRQPMQAMQLYLDVLGERMSEPRLDKTDDQCIMQKLQATHANLSEILNSFLDISQLDSGAMRPKMKVFDLVELLHQIHAQHLPSASAAGLTFQMHAPATAIMIHSDPSFVKGILANLISNAIRYTLRGGILLVVRQREAKACLEVCDNGPGIEESKQDLIFQEFVQLNNPQHDRNKGVGLGLTIANRICHQLGGRIQLRSRPGRGSVFSFDLPLALASEQQERSDTVLKHMHLAGMLVFVIDDDVDVRDSLKIVLEQWQCEVMSFADGDDALAAMQGRCPDAILSDYRLPNKTTGIDVVGQLRKLAGKSIPALLLTGDTELTHLNIAVEAGLPMLVKPVAASKLHLFLDRCTP